MEKQMRHEEGRDAGGRMGVGDIEQERKMRVTVVGGYRLRGSCTALTVTLKS